MATNKHKRAFRGKKEKKSGGAAEGDKAAGEGLPAESTKKPSFNFEGFNGPQLSGFIFLSAAFAWLIRYGTVAIHEKEDSPLCGQYIHNVEKCSTLDIQMTLVKYYSGILATVMAALSMIVVWSSAPLFLRLNTVFCVSPLLTTIIALQATREWMNPLQTANVGMNVTVLLVVGAGTLWYSPDIATFRTPSLSLQSMTLLTLSVAHGYEILRLGMEGVLGLLKVETEAGVTDPATVLIYFLCVDRATFIGILMFGLFFLDDNQKKNLLLFHGFNQLVGLFFHLPKLEGMYADPEYQRNLLVGAAMFSFTAWLAGSTSAPETPAVAPSISGDDSTRESSSATGEVAAGQRDD